MFFGVLGITTLLIAYFILNTKYSKYFLGVDSIATVFLIIHAYQIGDLVFVIVNFLILNALIYKHFKGGIK